MIPKIDNENGGDVIGPNTSTDEAIARFNGTTGDEIQNSLATINDVGETVFQTSVDSHNAFTIKDSAGNNIFVGETRPFNLATITPSAFRIEPFGFGPIPGSGSFTRGMRYRAEIGSGTQTNAFRGFDTLLRAAGSASATGTNSFRASNAAIAWNSTGTCASMIGMQNFLACGGGGSVDTGTVTEAVANKGLVGFNTNNSGNFTDGYCFWAEPIRTDATHTITNFYGFYAKDAFATGITNGYAFFAEDQSAGGTAIQTGTGIHIFGDDVTIGQGAAGQDYTLTFDGETNDGVITWMEDEDYFQIADDVVMDENLTIGDGASGFTLQTASILTRETIHNTSAGGASEVELALLRHDNVGASYGSLLIGGRTRGTVATPTAVADGDMLTSIVAIGYDDLDYAMAARIDFLVDGTPGAGDMPGRIVFGTSPDGAEVPVEALRISNDQKSSFSGNANPISDDGAALGEVGTAWSDLALASGSVIDFNNDIQLTHSSNALTMTGGGLFQNATSLTTGSLYQSRYSANSFASNQFFRKSRNASIGGHTVVQDNDSIGIGRYYGSDGSAFVEGAEIKVAVDGTPGAGDMPMEIAFITQTPGGALSTKMIVRADGKVGVGTLVPVSDFEVNGSRGRDITTLAAATLTLGASHDLIAVTYTGTGAVTITLPSATSSWNSTNNIGRSYEIKDAGANASVNNITINRAGADTIITDITGDTSATINGDGDALIITAISATTWITH